MNARSETDTEFIDTPEKITQPVAPPDPDNSSAAAEKVCPKCKRGIMDYDGLLNLFCPVCGFIEGGCFT